MSGILIAGFGAIGKAHGVVVKTIRKGLKNKWRKIIENI